MQNNIGSLMIEDIRYALQGAGPHAGRTAVLVKLALHEQNSRLGEKSTHSMAGLEAGLLPMLSNQQCDFVVIKGREPLLQNIIPLVDLLNNHGVSVCLETTGTAFIEGLGRFFSAVPGTVDENIIVCSPRTLSIDPRVAQLVGAWMYEIKAHEANPDDGLPNGVFRAPRDGAPIYLDAYGALGGPMHTENWVSAARACLRHGYRMSALYQKLESF